MKKTRILALSLIVMVMLMGAGYAYWSDTLTINNQVSTGEFKVELAEPTWYLLDGQDPFQDGTFDNISTDGYAQARFKPFVVTGKQKLNLTLVNMYPGKCAVLDTHFENLGTIPAVLKKVIVTPETDELPGPNGAELTNMDDAQKGKIKVTGVIEVADDTSKHIELDTTLAGLPEALAGMETWRLEPGKSIDFNSVTFELPKEIVNADNMENLYTKCKIEFEFTQHNDTN